MEQESGSPVPSKPSLEDSPMSQVAKLKAKQRTRSKNKGTVNLSFGGEEEVSPANNDGAILATYEWKRTVSSYCRTYSDCRMGRKNLK